MIKVMRFFIPNTMLGHKSNGEIKLVCCVSKTRNVEGVLVVGRNWKTKGKKKNKTKQAPLAGLCGLVGCWLVSAQEKKEIEF